MSVLKTELIVLIKSFKNIQCLHICCVDLLEVEISRLVAFPADVYISLTYLQMAKYIFNWCSVQMKNIV